MPFAVALTLDKAASGLVESLWRRLAEAGLSERMLRLGYPPHVTLGLYDQLDPDKAAKTLAAVIARQPPMSLRLDALGVFPGLENVLWLAPPPDPHLLALQADLHGALAVEPQPHYRVGAWLPHCTLAPDLDAAGLQAALGLLTADWAPISGAFASIDLLRFEPVKILWRMPLDNEGGLLL